MENCLQNVWMSCFELLEKLSIDYFLLPWPWPRSWGGGHLGRATKNLDEITDYIAEKQGGNREEMPLGNIQSLFQSSLFYMVLGTAPNVDVFIFAAGQVKHNVDLCLKIGGIWFLCFWGGREGYDTLLKHETWNWNSIIWPAFFTWRSIMRDLRVFTGDFYIEPKPLEPTKHQYDYDCVDGVLPFFKNMIWWMISNWISKLTTRRLAGHTFQHELRVARNNGIFGFGWC